MTKAATPDERLAGYTSTKRCGSRNNWLRKEFKRLRLFYGLHMKEELMFKLLAIRKKFRMMLKQQKGGENKNGKKSQNG